MDDIHDDYDSNKLEEAGSTAEDFIGNKPQTVFICPKCGGDDIDWWDETDGQDDYIREYYCKGCKMRI